MICLQNYIKNILIKKKHGASITAALADKFTWNYFAINGLFECLEGTVF